jgi:glyoxylase-like metal-dependent hydrolase (beta-lactamase superfamily II)
MRGRTLVLSMAAGLLMAASVAVGQDAPAQGRGRGAGPAPEVKATVPQDATATLQAVSTAIGAGALTSVEFEGKGSSYNFGQAVNVSDAWPRFILRSYKAEVDYATPAWRQEMDRTQLDGTAPFGGFRNIQVVSGENAWNVGANNMPAPAPANVAERQLQVWMTPAGFVKAALANHAMERVLGRTKVITFTTPDHHTVTGVVEADNLISRVSTRIDNPVLGDMLWVARYADYKTFGDVKFPTRIIQTQGGHPVLDLMVTEVKPNGAEKIDVPAGVMHAEVPPVKVETTKLADGVWYLRGGTHHSVVVEFKDYVTVIEGPLSEARSLAVIAEVHKLVPDKPIKYLVNTHNHFDHLGGVRTYVAEGATIITPQSNVNYYQHVFTAPHTLDPDMLQKSPKKATIDGVMDKKELKDDTQTLDLYVRPIAGHNDAMIIAYLPKSKILVEADAWTPPAANAPPPGPDAKPNPFTVELYNEVEALKLDVAEIAALHGPGERPFADFKKAAGKS